MRPHPNNPNGDESDAIDASDETSAEVSRSQRRREALDVLKLAQALADLPEGQLGHVPLSEDLLEEVRRTRSVKQQIARKRQTQFLAKLLRRLDGDELEAIRAALEHDRDLARRETAALHQVEAWRERLIEHGDDALNDLLGQFPTADRQQLRQLVRHARNERAQNKPPHALRELFRLLQRLTNG